VPTFGRNLDDYERIYIKVGLKLDDNYTIWHNRKICTNFIISTMNFQISATKCYYYCRAHYLKLTWSIILRNTLINWYY